MISVFSNTAIKRISVCPTATRLAIVSAENELVVVDLPTGKVVLRSEGSTTATFTPDGEYLVRTAPFECDEDGVIRLWDLSAARQLTELDERVRSIAGLQFNPDGTGLIAWGDERRLHTRSF